MQLTTCTEISRRPMIDGDIDFLRQLFGTTRNDIACLPWPDDEKAQFLNHQFQAQHFHYQQFFSEANFDIVLAGETRIGRFYVQYGSTEFRIIDIAILPEFQNRGIATNLVQKILDRAELENMPVRLRVEPNNPALQWYLRLGFEKIADELANWHMEWKPRNSE